MTPRAKAALLWGVTGALVFLVGHQAYLLLDGRFLGVGPVAAVTVLVFGATTAAAYYLEGRITAERSAPAGDGVE